MTSGIQREFQQLLSTNDVLHGHSLLSVPHASPILMDAVQNTAPSSEPLPAGGFGSMRAMLPM